MTLPASQPKFPISYENIAIGVNGQVAAVDSVELDTVWIGDVGAERGIRTPEVRHHRFSRPAP